MLKLLKLDMSIDVILYNRHKIKAFIICFSPIIQFISVYLIFCKHIASMKFYYKLSIYCFISLKSLVFLVNAEIFLTPSG